MFSPGLVQDRQNAATAQAMTNRAEGPPGLSGNYRNARPGITEIRVREFAKPALHNEADAKPFKWRANPDEIIAARNRGFQLLESIH
jgi:hypothetical protein